jgi:hypothetical protein
MKKHVQISIFLTELYQNPEFHNKLTLGKLLDLLGAQAFGIGTLVFALPSILPCTAIPGVSLLFGAPILFLGFQLAFFQKKPWLPQWLRRKKLNSASFTHYLKQSIPYIQRCERIIRPRYSFSNNIVFKSLIGIVLTLLSILLILPIPFSNVPLGILIAIIALGLIENDGLVLLLSFFSGIVTIIFYSEVIRWLIVWILEVI